MPCSGFRERLLADPGFMVKVAIEVGIGVCTKTTAGGWVGGWVGRLGCGGCSRLQIELVVLVCAGVVVVGAKR